MMEMFICILYLLYLYVFLSLRLNIFKYNKPFSYTWLYQVCLPTYPSISMVKDRLNLITQNHVCCIFEYTEEVWSNLQIWPQLHIVKIGLTQIVQKVSRVKISWISFYGTKSCCIYDLSWQVVVYIGLLTYI